MIVMIPCRRVCMGQLLELKRVMCQTLRMQHAVKLETLLMARIVRITPQRTRFRDVQHARIMATV